MPGPGFSFHILPGNNDYLCRVNPTNVRNWVLYIFLGMLISSCELLRQGFHREPAKVTVKTAPVGQIQSRPLPQPSRTSREESQEPVPDPDNVITNVPAITPEMFYDLQFKYAILLDRPVEEMQNHDFLAFVERWYGTRYRMGGSDSTGIDCSGFVQQYMSYMYRLNLPRTSVEQYENCRRVPQEELREGDLVFFHIQRRKPVSHVGVYLGNNKFIHASTRYGVVISDLNEPYYKDHFAGAGSYR